MTHQSTSAVGTLLHPYDELRLAQQPLAWDAPRVSRRWDIRTPDAVAKRSGLRRTRAAHPLLDPHRGCGWDGGGSWVPKSAYIDIGQLLHCTYMCLLAAYEERTPTIA